MPLELLEEAQGLLDNLDHNFQFQREYISFLSDLFFCLVRIVSARSTYEYFSIFKTLCTSRACVLTMATGFLGIDITSRTLLSFYSYTCSILILCVEKLSCAPETSGQPIPNRLSPFFEYEKILFAKVMECSSGDDVTAIS